MATVRVRIVILTVPITLSVCPFNRMAHTANSGLVELVPFVRDIDVSRFA
jgi:hypothetical protein